MTKFSFSLNFQRVYTIPSFKTFGSQMCFVINNFLVLKGKFKSIITVKKHTKTKKNQQKNTSF